jgi:hypothetical protein
MHSIVVRPHDRRHHIGSLRVPAGRAGARGSRPRERHVGETAVTTVMATLSLAIGLGVHDVGVSARASLLFGILAYVAIVLFAERVHLDDRL